MLERHKRYRSVMIAVTLLTIGALAACTSDNAPGFAFWISTSTPSATETATPTPTATHTATTTVTNTYTPSATPTATHTETATATATSTPTFTATPSFTPSLTPTHTWTPTPSPTETIEPLKLVIANSPLTVQQGHTLPIRVEASRPVSLTAFIEDMPLHFAETASGGWTVAGFGPWAEARAYALQVTGWDQAGQEAVVTSTLFVQALDYGTDYITISPALSPLLAPDVRQQETEYLHQVFAGVSPKALWDGAFILPVNNVITSPFGRARSYNQAPPSGFHAGTDFRGATGVPVAAAAAGRVALAKKLEVRGNAVVLDHGLGVYTLYGHMSEISVRPGQMVERGEVIGAVGQTGLVTGPHLHWEVRVQGQAVDPLEWTERTFP